MLIVDAANVVGSRPTGWWRDRASAAADLVDAVRAAARDGRLHPPVALVMEGAAIVGAPAGRADGVEVVHAPGEGDDTVVSLAAGAAGRQLVVVVSADRALGQRVRDVGAEVVGPRWLLDRLDG